MPNGVDFGTLAVNLLLYDRYILESSRLRELPFLLQAWGPTRVTQLLKSGALDIHCDAVAIAYSNHDDPAIDAGRGRIRISRIDFGVVRVAEPEKMVSEALAEGLKLAGVGGKAAIRLKEQAAKRLLRSDPRDGTLAHQQLLQDLKSNSSLLRDGVLLALSKETGVELPPDRVELVFELEADRGFAATTNLHSLAGIDHDITRKVILSGLGAVAGLNERVARMQIFNAMSGVKDSEVAVLDARLKFLLAQVVSQPVEDRFKRIIQLTGLPDLSAAEVAAINIERLLDVRQSTETREFRTWLWSASDADEQELSERFASLRQKIGVRVGSTRGRAIRWIASTGLGAIPGPGTIVGGIAGALDAFVIDKLFPRSGVVAFLGQHYPTIFRD